MSGRWCVYWHENRANGKRYIGITSQKPERRWQNGAGYTGNPRFSNAIKKYGWDGFRHEVLYAGLNKETAERLEMELIAKYQTQDPEHGYNIREGGNVSPIAQETREKISAKNKGRILGPLKPETKKKQSEALRGRFAGAANPMYGKPGPRRGVKLSAETRAKISEAMRGKLKGEKNPMHGKDPALKGNGKAVRCVETGEVFGSIGEAARRFDLNKGQLWRACNTPTRTAGGYHWLFITTSRPTSGQCVDIQIPQERRKKSG